MAEQPTMTLHECAEAFRANQVSVDEKKLGDALEAGQFPFADVLVGKTGGHRSFMIWRKLFYEWLRDRMRTDEVVEI